MLPRCLPPRSLSPFSRLLWAAALLSGCGAELEPAESSALRRQFPEQAAAVLAGREAFVREGEGFRLGAAASEGASRLDVVLPRDGSAPIRFRTPTGAEVRVVEHSVWGEGMTVDRAVAYRRAGGTSYWTATERGAEEWLLLEGGVARGGGPAAAWEVEGAAVRGRGGAVEVVDERSGAPVIRVTAPRAYAASGRPVAVALRARGSRIELSVEVGGAGGEVVLVDPAWEPAGLMNGARGGHTATLLEESGQVLVAGGFGHEMPLDSAELYDPTGDTWATTDHRMTHARYSHTATLLKSGEVLVIGGGPDTAPGSVERYDPTTGAWTAVKSMSLDRLAFTATLLPSGLVLVAGGDYPPIVLETAELYDPTNDTWTATGPMREPRLLHTATLLLSGLVLVTGGSPRSGPGTAELYDPADGSWPAMSSMAYSRMGHTATLLKSGHVLVAGGSSGDTLVDVAELYDPATNTWTSTEPMNIKRLHHTATLLPSGEVLVTGGGRDDSTLASAELYDPATNAWTLAEDMTQPRDEHTATLLPSGEVLVAGGGDGMIAFETSERYGLAPGEVCTDSALCVNEGVCVDGTCCKTPCPCGACDAEGECSRSGHPAKVGDECAPPSCDGETRSIGPSLCTAGSSDCLEPATVDCIAYRCDQATGACKSACTSLDDCSPRFVCNLQGHCVRPPPPAPGAVGGCGVAPGRAASSAACAAGVALVALAATRRRRRSTAAALVALAAVLAGAPVALARPAATPSAMPAAAAPATPPATPAPAATPSATPAAAAPATPPATPAPPDASPDAAPPDAAEPPPAENPVAEARAHFERGLDLYRQGAWEAALAEFLASRQVYPTWSATSSAALCLQQLRRYDEALALFETLLSDFSQKLPPDTRSAAQQAVVRLRGLVGTVDIAGAEIGASVMVDGHRRGDYPMPAPLRVAAGSHAIRVYKEGFEPFETRVDVAGGQVVRILSRLQKLVESGRLRVTEQQSKVLDVLVDGYTVGKTPWEGALPPGQHSVVLRGPGDLGTMPASVIVRLKQTTPVALRAEELTSTLRIEPSPVCASITVDGVTFGSGVWEGRLSSGPHRVEVAAGGFIAARREVLLARGARVVLPVALERVKLGGPSGRFLVELVAAPAFVPSLGGAAAGQCGGACSSGIGAGALGVFYAGYELWSGFGFGVMTGYLQVHQTVTARRMSLEIQDPLPESIGTVDDALALSGLLAGGWAGLSLGERTRLSMRLGAGALLGAVRDERTGTFTSSSKFEFRVDPTAARDAASFFVMTPEVRAGLRFGEHLELTAGLAAAVLVRLKEPMWTNPSQGVYGRIDDKRGYFGRFEEEPLAGEVLVAIAPGIGARYTF
ncbi:kelch repeat-containing protein [Sorangium sp. So ce118]